MAATARTAGHGYNEPGEIAMTRHGVIQPAVGAQPPAMDPRVFMAIPEANKRAYGPAPGRKHRAEIQRSGLSASITALPRGGPATADTGRRSKSP